MMSSERQITMEEVAKHNKQDDCWLVIGNDKTGEFGFNLRTIQYTILATNSIEIYNGRQTDAYLILD